VRRENIAKRTLPSVCGGLAMFFTSFLQTIYALQLFIITVFV
jgi:hypothetical protein